MAKIDIYTVRYCPYCQDAKELLSRKGLSYHEIDVTGKRDVRKEMIQRAKGRSTYPQIFIGATHVGGCDDLYALEESGTLDDDGRQQYRRMAGSTVRAHASRPPARFFTSAKPNWRRYSATAALRTPW